MEFVLAGALANPLAPLVLAQATHIDDPTLGSSSTPSASSGVTATSMSEGVVKKVNLDNDKITIKHGELKNLNMLPMMMVFHVNNPALLG